MRIPFVALGLLMMTLTPALGAPITPDQVLINAHLVTGAGAVAADAIAIQGTRIVAVGDSQELAAACSAPCRKIDLKGSHVTPGFHDAHSHPTSGGAGYFRLKVSGSSASSIAQAVRSYAAANPTLPWIHGRGWYAAGFGTHFPTRQDLDAGESERPVTLIDTDGHTLWANTAAIRAAGLTASTPDPEGGKIIRDSRGEPSGVFLEEAISLVTDKMPSPPGEMLARYAIRGQQDLLAGGFTSFHGGPVDLSTAKTYEALEKSGELKQRAFLWFDLTADDKEFEELVAFARSRPRDSLVQVSAFKGFVDGVISAYSAALLEPYSDKQDTTGVAHFTQEELNRLVLRANAAGFPVALHSIGDRAVRMSLDAFENSAKILQHSLINRIEHIESINPLDAPRFGRLNVAASMQPAHMHFGGAGSYYYYPRLGNERVKWTFAWNLLRSNGAPLVFGTDYPVVDADVIESIYCAVNRQFFDGTVFEGSQRVPVDAALQAFTSEPARIAGFGDRIGQLKEGYEADLAIFDEDPSRAQSTSISSLRPRAMLVAGKVVYGSLLRL